MAKKISILRMSIIALSLIILMIPWYQLGFTFPNFMAGGKIIVNTEYLCVGFLFLITILLKIFSLSLVERKKKELKLIVSLEEAMETIQIEGLLILLAYNGFISGVIPLIIVSKEIIIQTMKKISADNGKMMEKSRLSMCEKIMMNVGILLLLFYNLPFELWNFYFADALVMIATILSVLNGCIYFFEAKNLIVTKKT